MTTLNIPLIRPFRTIVGVIGIKPNKHDGQGAWAKDSSKIPPGAWLGAFVVIGLFAAVAFVGAAAGF